MTTPPSPSRQSSPSLASVPAPPGTPVHGKRAPRPPDARPPDDRPCPPHRDRPWRSTAIAAAVVTAAGLAAAAWGTGPWADVLGDALYAVLVVVLVRVLLPRRSPLVHGVVAFAACAVVELAQLTDVPAAVVRAVPPARYLLGTTFVATDLLAYAAGSAAAVLTVTVTAWSSRPRRAAPAAGASSSPPGPWGS